jgi:hypothetical protein
MRAADRLARRLVDSAARRWPADLRDELARDWHAELDALESSWRALTFAGSLAVSPAVEEADEEQVTWAQRAAGWARKLSVPAALTLLAAALFNAAHLAQGRLGALAGAVALAAAAAVMVAVGDRTTVGRVVLLGAAGYAFLLAGNQVAVMPFMGWIDIGPAVLAWTILTAATVRVSTRLRATGRTTLAGVAAVAGAVLALDVAAAAGSLHAAAVLGVNAASAPSWFPLAMLPGGIADFGAYFADGTAAFGSLQQAGPAFHASDVLLGNASAMIGPLTLCSVAVVAGLLRRGSPRVPEAAGPPDAAGKVALGVVAGLGGLAIGEVLRRSGGAAELTLHRLVDNSAVLDDRDLAREPPGLPHVGRQPVAERRPVARRAVRAGALGRRAGGRWRDRRAGVAPGHPLGS